MLNYQALLTEAHPAAPGDTPAAGARGTCKVPAKQKAGVCSCVRHTGVAQSRSAQAEMLRESDKRAQLHPRA